MRIIEAKTFVAAAAWRNLILILWDPEWHKRSLRKVEK
jgi:hypothetical protein